MTDTKTPIVIDNKSVSHADIKKRRDKRITTKFDLINDMLCKEYLITWERDKYHYGLSAMDIAEINLLLQSKGISTVEGHIICGSVKCQFCKTSAVSSKMVEIKYLNKYIITSETYLSVSQTSSVQSKECAGREKLMCVFVDSDTTELVRAQQGSL